MRIVTANRLSDGRVIYVGAGAQPVDRIDQALVLDEGAAETVLTEALLREVFRIEAGVSPSPYHGRPHVQLMGG